MKNPLILAFCLLLNWPCYGQVFVQKPVEPSEIPSPLLKNEELLFSTKWEDARGTHVFWVTRVLRKSLQVPGIAESVCFSALLKAQEFIQSKNNWQPEWSFRDSVMDCPFDLWVGLLNPPFSLSDLDSNGIAEVFLASGNLCTADVFPVNLKLILRANNKTHLLEGAAYSEFFNGKKDALNFEYDLSKTDTPESYDWFKKYLHGLGRFNNLDFFEGSDRRFLPFMVEKWKNYSAAEFTPDWLSQSPR